MFIVFLAVHHKMGNEANFHKRNVRTSGFDVVGEEVDFFFNSCPFRPTSYPKSPSPRGGKAAKFKMYEPHRVTIFYSKNSSVIRQRVTEH